MMTVMTTSTTTPLAASSFMPVPPTLQTAPAPQQSPQTPMMQPGVMAAIIGIPVVVLALAGIGFFMYRKKKSASRRRRDSMPYDEEFESLQKKHEEKFGVGHNY